MNSKPSKLVSVDETAQISDREAPGSNPGPSTILVFKIHCSRAAPEFDGAQPGHNFVGNYRDVAVRS
jgi:hypothetical protein